MARHGHKHHRGATPDVKHIKNVDVTHEESDVNVKAVAYFILGLLIAGIVILFVMRGLYRYFDRREERAEEQPATLVDHSQRLPQEPRLQGIPDFSNHPFDDMAALRAKEDEQLTSYGWVNQTTGTVHIPIEQAKKLLLERGLPTRPQGATTPPAGATARPGAQEQTLPAGSSPGRTPERSERR